MTEKKFDPTKPVQTRSGLPARIVCTNRKYVGSSGVETWPIMALYSVKGNEIAVSCQANGRIRSNEDSPCDLVNVPDIRYEYQNVYESGRSTAIRSPTQQHPTGFRLGYLKYTFEDNELKTVEFIRD